MIKYAVKLVSLVVIGFVMIVVCTTIFTGIMQALSVAGVSGWIVLMMWEAYIVFQEDTNAEIAEEFMSDHWMERNR